MTCLLVPCCAAWCCAHRTPMTQEMGGGAYAYLLSPMMWPPKKGASSTTFCRYSTGEPSSTRISTTSPAWGACKGETYQYKGVFEMGKLNTNLLHQPLCKCSSNTREGTCMCQVSMSLSACAASSDMQRRGLFYTTCPRMSWLYGTIPFVCATSALSATLYALQSRCTTGA